MRFSLVMMTAFGSMVLAACASSGTNDAAATTPAPAEAAAAPAPAMKKAKADMEAKSGSKIKGTVDFEDTADGLKVTYDVSGLKANKPHGFHVHEKGDCSSKDAKSAGSHYAKVADTGGTSKETPAKYAGDLPSITADAKGASKGTFTVKGLSIAGENAIKDRAIMIHGGPDDPKKSSPPRVGCGVIKETM